MQKKTLVLMLIEHLIEKYESSSGAKLSDNSAFKAVSEMVQSELNQNQTTQKAKVDLVEEDLLDFSSFPTAQVSHQASIQVPNNLVKKSITPQANKPQIAPVKPLQASNKAVSVEGLPSTFEDFEFD